MEADLTGGGFVCCWFCWLLDEVSWAGGFVVAGGFVGVEEVRGLVAGGLGGRRFGVFLGCERLVDVVVAGIRAAGVVPAASAGLARG